MYKYRDPAAQQVHQSPLRKQNQLMIFKWEKSLITLRIIPKHMNTLCVITQKFERLKMW